MWRRRDDMRNPMLKKDEFLRRPHLLPDPEVISPLKAGSLDLTVAALRRRIYYQTARECMPMLQAHDEPNPCNVLMQQQLT